MKVVHNNSKKRAKLTKEADEDWRDIGRAKELAGLPEEAIEAYENDLRASPLHENSYNRVMILHRKLKNYKEEAAVLHRAIRVFEDLYSGGKKKLTHGTRVRNLSKALLLSTGLTDKKGKSVYQPEPLGRWNKRLLTVNKRLKAS